MLRRLQSTLAWILVGLGIMQWAATPLLFKSAEEPAFWFFGGGMMLVVAGVLNSLRLVHGRSIPRLTALSVGTNVGLAFFWIAMAAVLTYKFNRYLAPYIALALIVANAGLSLYDAARSRGR